MREISRGGTLVASSIGIASLPSRRATDETAINNVRNRHHSKTYPNQLDDISTDRQRHRLSALSDRPRSTASEDSERDSASLRSSEEPPSHDCGDSDSADEDTVKCPVWNNASCPRANSSDTETSSTSSPADSDEGQYSQRTHESDYKTLTPSNRRLDAASSSRDEDFKWMPQSEAIPEPLSMDSRVDDYCSASLDRRRRVSGDRSERDRKSKSSISSKPPYHPNTVRSSPKSRRSRHEDPSPELQRRWNSYEHFRWPEGGWWPPPPPPPMCWCHGPPPPPPCCMHDRGWPSHPSLLQASTPHKQNDSDDRVRRLEADKDSLQLQVQVLSEQVSAQNEKMHDLERALYEARQRLEDAEQRLQKEMLQRSSLETQKLELLSKLSEMRLRVAERGVLERSPPPEAIPVTRPAPPRTPPANYGRQIERNNHIYSSLPRSSISTVESRLAFGKHQSNELVVAHNRGRSVPNLAEKEEIAVRGSPSPSLREVRNRVNRIEGGDLFRTPLRATAQPRLQRDRPAPAWQTTDIREWDTETTCGFLESLGLETYIPSAKSWLQSTPDAKGILATASCASVEKELGIKHPMHRKKIMLGVISLSDPSLDDLMNKAGELNSGWVERWVEDVGAGGLRGSLRDVSLDGRLLHRLTHHELHHHLKVHLQLQALSIRRGIQVLRNNQFNPDTMIRRAPEDSSIDSEDVSRWSSHRVMQWLKEIDLAEYAPNLRGAGVHGGLMLLEPRFTAELLAALLNIPASKTLLRRHLTQRFNDLLGRDVIQQKRNAEQTLGYQPLTATTKYKVPKKSQFSLKRKKDRDELDTSDLVCPFIEDNSSGDINSTPTMKVRSASHVESAVYLPRDLTEKAH